MKRSKQMTPAVKYFFGHLERKSERLQEAYIYEQNQHRELAFDEVEQFFRALMTQNIFIHTVGMNGKRESTILSKAMFSMNKVVRVYYSTSFDEDHSGFIKIRPDNQQQKILVERMHGYRPIPELLYASASECHVIRFMVRWLMRRIDWDKTKLNNLDLYKVYQAQQQADVEAEIAEMAAKQEALEMEQALERQAKGFKERRKAKLGNG